MSGEVGALGTWARIEPSSIDLHRFMVRWRGEPDVPPSRLAAEHRWLPEPLKDWYELTTRWTSPYMRLKRMLAPGEIQATGKAVTFMTDPTGDWFWVFDLDDPDVVYDRELYEPWTRTAEDLAEFLVHSALNEAVWTAAASQHAAVPEELLPAFLIDMTEVGFGGWQWPMPNGHVFVGDRTVAEVMVMPEGALWRQTHPGYFEVLIASPEPGVFGRLDALPDIRWFKSRRRGREIP